MENLIVGEAQETASFSVKNLLPFAVVSLLLYMYVSINFNDQTLINTEKIHDEPFQRSLSSKFINQQIHGCAWHSTTQLLPESFVCADPARTASSVDVVAGRCLQLA